MRPQSKSIQQSLISLVQSIISDKYSLVFELSELLEISNDSVYRRLRGETLLSIEEVQKICMHYKISFDSICRNENINSVTFQFQPITKEDDFKKYLISIRDDLKVLQNKEDVNIMYAAIDIPIPHNFKFPVVAAFKFFYWLKSIANVLSYQNLKFSPGVLSKEYFDIGMEIHKSYCYIPSTEIWTDLILNSILKQIDYYWESGEFLSKDDALQLCEEVKQEFEYMKNLSETGSKLPGNDNLSGENKNFNVYYSDIEIANNCILVKNNKTKTSYFTTQTFNKLVTSNIPFNTETERWLNNIIKKSTAIGIVGEKLRYQFFKKAFDEIEKQVNKIKHS